MIFHSIYDSMQSKVIISLCVEKLWRKMEVDHKGTQSLIEDRSFRSRCVPVTPEQVKEEHGIRYTARVNAKGEEKGRQGEYVEAVAAAWWILSLGCQGSNLNSLRWPSRFSIFLETPGHAIQQVIRFALLVHNLGPRTFEVSFTSNEIDRLPAFKIQSCHELSQNSVNISWKCRSGVWVLGQALKASWLFCILQKILITCWCKLQALLDYPY